MHFSTSAAIAAVLLSAATAVPTVPTTRSVVSRDMITEELDVSDCNSTERRGVSFYSGPPTGPLIDHFADPCIILDGSTYWAYATGKSVQVAHSTDLKTWTETGVPGLPSVSNTNWINLSSPQIWAPDVVHDFVNGGFIMYFSASTKQDHSKHCIGAAHANSPAGPFVAEPDVLICDIAAGGAIDAAQFVDPNNKQAQYLVYKTDANSIGKPTTLSVTALASSGPKAGLAVAPGADANGTPILHSDGTLDNAGVIEGPFIFWDGGAAQWTLLFSSGVYSDSSYKTGVATSKDLKSLFRRQSSWLIETGQKGLTGAINGPGGLQLLRVTQAQSAPTAVFHNRQAAGQADTTVGKGVSPDIRALWTAGITSVHGRWRIQT